MKLMSVFAVAIVAIASVAVFTSSTRDPNTTHHQAVQTVRAIKIPSSMNFAGEPVPLTNRDVYERVDREMLNNVFAQSATMQSLKRSTRFFPIIEPILAQYGVPDDFKYLAVAESALKDAVSSAGAKGVWQFMKEAGTYYGLTINDEVDERYNIEKSTEAACKYLVTAYKKFGSWTLAAASYNMGEPRLQQMIKNQMVNSYYDLYLNDETSRYVFRVLSFKEIFTNRDKYGFMLDAEDYYPQFEECILIAEDKTIPSLVAYAQKYGITYRQLKLLNPWLLQSSLANKEGKSYKIKIPKR